MRKRNRHASKSADLGAVKDVTPQKLQCNLFDLLSDDIIISVVSLSGCISALNADVTCHRLHQLSPFCWRSIVTRYLLARHEISVAECPIMLSPYRPWPKEAVIPSHSNDSFEWHLLESEVQDPMGNMFNWKWAYSHIVDGPTRLVTEARYSLGRSEDVLLLPRCVVDGRACYGESGSMESCNCPLLGATLTTEEIGDDRCVIADASFPLVTCFQNRTRQYESGTPWPYGSSPHVTLLTEEMKTCNKEIHESSRNDAVECVSIGLASYGFPLNGVQPGWTNLSFGYHGDDGKFFFSSGVDASFNNFGPRYGPGDTVGCGFLTEVRAMFFTLNGKYVGATAVNSTSKSKEELNVSASVSQHHALMCDAPESSHESPSISRRKSRNVRVSSCVFSRGIYPVVGIDSHSKISVNFGAKPFQFDIASLDAVLEANPIAELRPVGGHIIHTQQLLHLENEIVTRDILLRLISDRIIPGPLSTLSKFFWLSPERAMGFAQVPIGFTMEHCRSFLRELQYNIEDVGPIDYWLPERFTSESSQLNLIPDLRNGNLAEFRNDKWFRLDEDVGDMDMADWLDMEDDIDVESDWDDDVDEDDFDEDPFGDEGDEDDDDDDDTVDWRLPSSVFEQGDLDEE